MKLVKVLFFLVLFLVVVLVGGGYFLINNVDPNDYKTQISDAVFKQTGRQLNLAGDLSWSFYPSLGINANEFSLANRDGFKPANMVSAKEARIKVKLKPLLQKRLEVDQVTLVEPDINLAVNAAGDSNWADLLGDHADSIEQSSSEQAGLLAGGLIIQGVNIENGKVSWNDDSAGQHYQLEKLDLTTGTIEPGQPTDIELSVLAQGDALPGPAYIKANTTILLNDGMDAVKLSDFTGNVSMTKREADIAFDVLDFGLSQQQIDIKGLTLNHTAEAGAEMIAGKQTLRAGDVSINLQQETLSAPALALDSGDLNAKADLNITNLLSAPILSGALETSVFDLQGLLTNLGVDLGLGDGAFKAVQIQAPKYRFDMGNESLSLPAFVLNADDAKVTGGIEASGLLSKPKLSGSLQTSTFSLRQQLHNVGIDLGLGDKAFNAVSIDAPQFTLDLGQETAKLPAFTLKSDDLEAQGSVTLSQLMSDIKAEGSLKTSTFSLRQQLHNVGIDLGVGDKALNAVSIDAPQFALDLGQETAKLSGFTLKSDDLEAQGSANISQLLSNLKAEGSLKTTSFNLREQLSRLGIDVGDMPAAALQQASIDANYVGGLDSIELANMTAIVDESTVTGNASASFSQPRYRFNLNLNQINADHYMSATQQAAAEEATPAAAAVALPFAVLKGVDAKGTLKAGLLKLTGITSENVVLNVDSASDKISIAPLKASLYRGVISNDLTYDISGQVPKVTVKSTLDKLNLGPFLTDMELTERLEGLGNVSLDLVGSGATSDDLIASLAGKLNIDLNDGAIIGANIQKALMSTAQLAKQLKGKDYLADVAVGDRTEFSNFSSGIVIKDGVMRANSIDMSAPLFRLSGSGNIDLKSLTIDLRLVAAVVKSLEGQGGAALADLKGEKIPLSITGSVTDPKIRIDVAALAKAQLKREVEKRYLGGEKISEKGVQQTVKDKIAEKVAEKHLGGEKLNEVDAKAALKEKLQEKLDEKLGKDDDPDASLEDKLKKEIFKKLFQF